MKKVEGGGNIYRTGIGQDSHRFVSAETDKNRGEKSNRKLMLGGVEFEGHTALDGNSDADVVLHSIVNAISGITCVNILGQISDDMCLKHGITDSACYIAKALEALNAGGEKIVHVSIVLECLVPRITPRIPEMRASLSDMLGIAGGSIGITATSGEGLTAFGRGEGIQAFCCVTAVY